MRILVLLVALIATQALAETVTFPGPDGTIIRAQLHRPPGPIRGAIVALHGCGGPFPSRDQQWTEALIAQGQIILFPDSFGSRGLGSQCQVPGNTRPVTPDGVRRQDAIAAAEWLRHQPGVPPGGLVLLGWSDGGSTTLATAQTGRHLPHALFRRFIAFYPGCRVPAITPGWATEAPIDILMGEADDWTPIAPCRQLATTTTNITLHPFPGAYHDFDSALPLRIRQNIPSSQNPDHTVHVGGNPAARAAALDLVARLVSRQ